MTVESPTPTHGWTQQPAGSPLPLDAVLADPAFADALASLARSGKPHAALESPFSPQQIEALYALGYQLYQSARHEDALKVFTGLLLMDGSQPRFQRAYAKTLHQLGRHAEAAIAYVLAHTLSDDDPQALLLAAQCMLATGHAEDAAGMLQEALQVCDAPGASRHAGVRERAASLADLLKRTHNVQSPSQH